MSSVRRRVWLAAVVALAAVAGGCGGGGGSPAGSVEPGGGAGATVSPEPLFDPFIAPTRSGIDLERLGEAAASITPGQADCAAAATTDVAGIALADAPPDSADAGTVAEVVRITGGCLLVQYAELGGRTIAQLRDLLAQDPTVFAVSEPAYGYAPDVEP
ncbi:hypothetical protein [Candidatus Poriferisocius sp.]|uniref:hypothetical protein n=1 Tax=Candidatus Poriferisocius sp. TaxID=3101276 RepID=UPI003B0223CC